MADGINALIARGVDVTPKFDLMQATGNALALKGAQQQMGRREQEWEYQDEQRENQKFASAFGMALKAQNAETANKIMKHFGYEGGDLKFEGPNVEYTDVEGWGVKGSQKDALDFFEAIKSGELDLKDPTQAMAVRSWAASRGLSLTGPGEKKGFTLGPGQKRFGPEGGEPIATGGEKPAGADRALKTWILPDGTLKNLPNNVPPPEGARPYSTGMDIEVTPEGGTRIRTGVAPGDVTRKTKGALETKIVSGQEQIARMQKISSEFKPEYQEIGTRLGAAWTGIKAKLGRDVSKKDKTFLIAFKKYQRKAIENINLYIKEMTGAQMSEKEADRLRLAQPDPGENWWQGDDPITFKAKMDDVIKMARASVARHEFYRNQGLSESAIRKMVKDGTAAPLEEIASRLK